VNVRESAPIVLIIDEDIGLVWWLGEILIEAGYRPVPALNSQEALSLSKALKLVPDVVVINPELPGVSALLRTLSRSSSPKIVLIQDPRYIAASDIQAHAKLDRPSGWEPVSRPAWLRKMKGILKQLGTRAAS
jgi:DNA-binding NtrC family response regulator